MEYILHVIFIILVAVKCELEIDEMRGRISIFDEVLMENMDNIGKAQNMAGVKRDLEDMESSVQPSDSWYTHLYYEVCKGMAKKGEIYLSNERKKMNEILSQPHSTSDELEAAYVKRNVINAFVDVSAQHVLKSMNLGPSFMVTDPGELDLDLSNPDALRSKIQNLDINKFVKSKKDKKSSKNKA